MSVHIDKAEIVLLVSLLTNNLHAMELDNHLSVLLVEDDMIERMKFNRIIESSNIKIDLLEATNGEEALQTLRTTKSLPNIILLDLNMPRMNGIEFLKILKKDNRLKFIPTIILTTSNNTKDLLECYNNGIAGYILKPLKYEQYVDKMAILLSYWSINELISK